MKPDEAGRYQRLDVDDIDARRKSIMVRDKGAVLHRYQISKEGLEAIRDYIKHEREGDSEKWNSPALFLAAGTVGKKSERLTERVINYIWDSVAEFTGVDGRTPHSARHVMGRHLIDLKIQFAGISLRRD